jgi:fumarate hydratase, class I
MTVIRQEDFIASVAGALQYISYYHPEDYIRALAQAYEREQSPAARDAMAQILINSRMCYEGHRPVCQDTGIVNAFVKLGMDVRFEAGPGEELLDLQQMIDAGVRRAYLDPDEAKSKFVMLNPNDAVVDWVLETVPTMGAGWCPPGILGIGIGGTAEKAMLLAKQSLMDPIDIQDLIARGPKTTAEKLRVELYDKVNRLGIGAQGLGGLTTVLDVKVVDTPAHAANLPVAMIPNCAANRHAHIVLDGSGPVFLDPPPLDAWPKLTYDVSGAKRVNLDTVTREEAATWKPGEVLLLTGKLLTGRDAAHKRMSDMLNRGEKLPVDLKGRFIYYVGPVDPVRGEVVGPAGPTTATRMDKFTRQMLSQTGLLGMVGKAERGPEAIEAIREYGAVYLMAVGGAAYLVSKAIYGSRLLAFEDLGMEAIYEFDVKDMPVTVAVDSKGTSVHQTGPAEWQQRIAGIPILQ